MNQGIEINDSALELFAAIARVQERLFDLIFLRINCVQQRRKPKQLLPRASLERGTSA